MYIGICPRFGREFTLETNVEYGLQMVVEFLHFCVKGGDEDGHAYGVILRCGGCGMVNVSATFGARGDFGKGKNRVQSSCE